MRKNISSSSRSGVISGTALHKAIKNGNFERTSLKKVDYCTVFIRLFIEWPRKWKHGSVTCSKREHKCCGWKWRLGINTCSWKRWEKNSFMKDEILTQSSTCVQNTLRKCLCFRLGFKRTADLLIQNNADVNILGKDGKTALMHASVKGKNVWMIFVYVMFLIQALQLCVGSEEIVQMLIDAGAKVNAVGANKDSALIYAARRGMKD